MSPRVINNISYRETKNMTNLRLPIVKPENLSVLIPFVMHQLETGKKMCLDILEEKYIYFFIAVFIMAKVEMRVSNPDLLLNVIV